MPVAIIPRIDELLNQADCKFQTMHNDTEIGFYYCEESVPISTIKPRTRFNVHGRLITVNNGRNLLIYHQSNIIATLPPADRFTISRDTLYVQRNTTLLSYRINGDVLLPIACTTMYINDIWDVGPNGLLLMQIKNEIRYYDEKFDVLCCFTLPNINDYQITVRQTLDKYLLVLYTHCTPHHNRPVRIGITDLSGRFIIDQDF
jgi:hypothetical protein